MPIELIDKIKPANNAGFALVDAEDIEMPDGTRLSEYLAAEPKTLPLSGGNMDDGAVIYFGQTDTITNDTYIQGHEADRLEISAETDLYLYYGYNLYFNGNTFESLVSNVSNTRYQNGVVASGDKNPNKVWKTDANGNPGWQEEASTSLVADKTLEAAGWYRFATKAKGNSSFLVSIIRNYTNNSPEGYLLSVETGYNKVSIVQLNSSVETQLITSFRIAYKANNAVYFDLKYISNLANKIYIQIIPLGSTASDKVSLIDFEKDPDITNYSVKEISLSSTPIVGSIKGNATSLEGYQLTQNNNSPWGAIPKINSEGVTELGKYIDFHVTNDPNIDRDVRITADTDGLIISGTTRGSFSGDLSGNAATATKLKSIEPPNNSVSGLRSYFYNLENGIYYISPDLQIFLEVTNTKTNDYEEIRISGLIEVADEWVNKEIYVFNMDTVLAMTSSNSGRFYRIKDYHQNEQGYGVITYSSDTEYAINSSN